MNMKNCGHRNVRNQTEIKDSDKYITFGSLDNMIITSSEPKYYFRISGKGFITYLGINTNVLSNKNNKARFVINNISMKDFSKIIKEFGKLPYKGYVWKRPKNEPPDSYF